MIMYQNISDWAQLGKSQSTTTVEQVWMNEIMNWTCVDETWRSQVVNN